MMYPRLFLAKNLLLDDGVIFISIDDNEIHNLKMIMDEIFGEENFIGKFIIKSNPRGSQSVRHIANVHEYVISYGKNKNAISDFGVKVRGDLRDKYKYKHDDGRDYRLLGLRQRGGAWRREDRPSLYYPIYVNPDTKEISLEEDSNHTEVVYPIKPSTGEDGSWRWNKKKVKDNKEVLIGKQIDREGEKVWDVYQMDFLQDEEGNERLTKAKSIWDSKKLNYQNGTQEVKDLFDGKKVFDFPKPVYLLDKLLELTGVKQNDIVMDFFAGSCSTAHAVMKQNVKEESNVKYIMIQLPEKVDDDSEAIDEGFDTISEIGRKRIQRASRKIVEENPDINKNQYDFGFKTFELSKSNFLNWVKQEIEDKEELQKN